ncbi:uncharacterized protein SOCE26_024990 [Sorangium cellulosum]|uniref:CHAT domain-containing protein n=1 Tax=Sorangium cellulosum TaxID=56 RepID=A0A2L0EP66_SORCE|nr:CHAT domain-containing protein [Sorangium cellulosum]AUX41094.1 uncharacterized protein SOCE26_024990 [Sorangium cellulosum]
MRTSPSARGEERPVTILFLASNPKATDRLELDRELRAIERRLTSSRHRASLELLSRWAVEPDDLQRALLEVEPSVVHFSAHGTKGEALLLHDGAGNTAPVSKEALADLFGILKDRIRVVVLNACHSRPQAEAIVQHIDCAIGMSRAVGDDAALEFSAAFYQAIGHGRSVAQAFQLGLNALKLKDIPEEDTPALLARAGVDPAQVFLVGEPAPRPTPAPPPAAPPAERWPLPTILLSVFGLVCLGVLAATFLRSAPATPAQDAAAPPPSVAPASVTAGAPGGAISPAASGARR